MPLVGPRQSKAELENAKEIQATLKAWLSEQAEDATYGEVKKRKAEAIATTEPFC